MEVTDIHRSSCLLHAPTSAPLMEPSCSQPPMASSQRVPALHLPVLRPAHALKGHATNSAGRAIHRTGSIDPSGPHCALCTTSLMLSSCIRPSTTPGRRLPAAQPPLLRPTRAGQRDLVGTPRRHDCRRVESDEVVSAAAFLRPRGRAEASLIARAAGCLEQPRPDHLGGVEHRLSCESAPTRRRAKTRDVRRARRGRPRPEDVEGGPPCEGPAG
jgi:hypothetical protein